MSKWTGVITNVGNDLLSEWVNEKTLNFDNVMLGTGTVAEASMIAQSDLVSQKQIGDIVGSERVESGIRLKIQITAADVSYELNQIGVWASVENAEPVMLALYQYTAGVPVPSKAESPEFVYTFYALISTSNQGQWNVNVDTSALVTREQFDSHALDENNPHGMTCEQIGAAPAGYGIGALDHFEVATYTGTSDDVLALNNAQVDAALKEQINGIEEHTFKRIVLSFKNAGNFTGSVGHYYADIYKDDNGCATITIKSNSLGGVTLQNIYIDGNLGQWEWISPVMAEGVEYRTTDRLNGKAVYHKYTSDGKLQHRIDGESEYRDYAGLFGAAPSGYGLGGTSTIITDWNAATANGFYADTAGSEAKHSPFIGKAAWGYTIAHNASDDAIVQVAFTYAGSNWEHTLCQKIRHLKRADGWSEWEWVYGYGYGGSVFATATTATTTEAELETILTNHLSTMKGGEVKQIKFSCVVLGDWTFHGTLFRNGDSGAYGSLVAYAEFRDTVVELRKAYYNGKWYPFEWENPLFSTYVEYRTTERFNDKPVYAKRINFGKGAQGGKAVNITSDDIDNLVRVEGYWINGSNKYIFDDSYLVSSVAVDRYGSVSRLNVSMVSQGYVENYTGYPVVYYTKS